MFCAKPVLFKNMPKNQIASKPGCRPSEHLFVLKSVYKYYQTKKKCLIFTSFDLSKFYDVEQLKDCMSEVYNCQVKGRIYRLIYNMNKSVRIKIKTPVGVTDSEEVLDVVSQGTIESGIISSVNIGKGIDVAFRDSDSEVYY